MPQQLNLKDRPSESEKSADVSSFSNNMKILSKMPQNMGVQNNEMPSDDNISKGPFDLADPSRKSYLDANKQDFS